MMTENMELGPNSEHLAIVKKGAGAIEEWRLKNKRENLLLWGADLSKAKLSGANLKGSVLNFGNLMYADLSKTNLIRAKLFESNLSFVNLSESNLSGADLGYANLKGVTFSNTNLSRSNLAGTLFVYSAGKANLKEAIMHYTTLIACDMNDFENVETVKHKGPSFVDTETLLTSYMVAGDCFDTKLKPFFIDAGLSKALLDSLPEIVAGIAYCNCFVCYGEPDKKFAEKLVRDLKAEGVQCWIYSMDSTPGRRIWKEITEMRRKADKMIVLCSANSLIREAVKKEIEEQIDEEPENLVPISLDNLWKKEGFTVKRGERDLKQDLMECTYADFSEGSKYDASLNRLLRGLKRGKKIPRKRARKIDPENRACAIST
jgi:uncharacterized protein YjbI with pentapeptide repeats